VVFTEEKEKAEKRSEQKSYTRAKGLKERQNCYKIS
jgi:hypothetical protein